MLPKDPTLVPVASDRIDRLSKPRFKKDNESYFRSIVWPIPDETAARPASDHTLRLAKPKALYEGYQFPRSCIWEIRDLNSNYSASDRTEVLSRPVTRSEKNIKRDPFGVSKGALTAKLSERLREISDPVPDYSGLTERYAKIHKQN